MLVTYLETRPVSVPEVVPSKELDYDNLAPIEHFLIGSSPGFGIEVDQLIPLVQQDNEEARRILLTPVYVQSGEKSISEIVVGRENFQHGLKGLLARFDRDDQIVLGRLGIYLSFKPGSIEGNMVVPRWEFTLVKDELRVLSVDEYPRPVRLQTKYQGVFSWFQKNNYIQELELRFHPKAA